jgi:hypothetical protein
MFSREKSIDAAAPAYVCMGSFSMFLFGGVAGAYGMPGLHEEDHEPPKFQVLFWAVKWPERC